MFKFNKNRMNQMNVKCRKTIRKTENSSYCEPQMKAVKKIYIEQK